MTAIAKLTDRFTETEVDDEIVIMRLDNGEFFALSGTAAAIWRLIDGERDRVALIEAIGVQFEADETQIAADVDEFVDRLKGTGLLASR
jgi:hypothetical protein